MATITVKDLQNNAVGELELDDAIFDAPVKHHLLWEMTRSQLASRRGGNASTKGRSERAYSTAKMYRQKGTGRARRGSRRAAGIRGGGIVFGPKPRDFSYKIPKKARKAALRSALSKRFKEGSLVVVDNLELSEVKTKSLALALNTLQLPSGLLVDGTNSNLKLSARNLQNFRYLASEGLNVYDILRFDTLVMTRAAVDHVHGVLKP